jgi:hypothetical protein
VAEVGELGVLRWGNERGGGWVAARGSVGVGEWVGKRKRRQVAALQIVTAFAVRVGEALPGGSHARMCAAPQADLPSPRCG